MAQQYVWPPSYASFSDPSVGTIGQTAPTSAAQSGAQDPSGTLQPLHEDASGNLLVSIAAAPSSTPLATNLTQVGGVAITQGQKTMASSIPVAIASNQSTLPISAASLPLPVGAATESTLSTLSSSITAKLAGSLTPVAYNEVALTYVASGNGTGQIATAVYKLAGTTVKTLTLSYDGSDRLSGVVAS